MRLSLSVYRCISGANLSVGKVYSFLLKRYMLASGCVGQGGGGARGVLLHFYYFFVLK